MAWRKCQLSESVSYTHNDRHLSKAQKDLGLYKNYALNTYHTYLHVFCLFTSTFISMYGCLLQTTCLLLWFCLPSSFLYSFFMNMWIFICGLVCKFSLLLKIFRRLFCIFMLNYISTLPVFYKRVCLLTLKMVNNSAVFASTLPL